MNVSPVNFTPNFNVKNIKNSTPAFKGNDKKDDEVKPETLYTVDMRPFITNPSLVLKTQLLEDGFTPKDLKKYELFTVVDMRDDVNFGVLMEHFDELPQYATQIKSAMFKHIPKDDKDVRVMLRLYRSMKEKFVTDDVIKHNQEFGKILKEVAAFLGETVDDDQDTKDLILQVLGITTTDNVTVAQALLDDENFNNIHIHTALMGLKDEKKAQYGLEVLKTAQEVGYEKDFSPALAILISEANPDNMSVIKRLIYEEQDFLSQNDEFVSQKLMSFLRFWDTAPILYMAESDMTLANIDELLDMASDDD